MNVHAPMIPTEAEARPDDPRRDIRAGAAIVFLFFAVLLGWAAVAPLDAGARAPGVVAVSGNRQSVQHREGGVVTAIHVREGVMVEAGQLLVEMAAPDVRATERALTSDYLLLLAQRARLMAESRGHTSFPVPAEFADLRPEDRPLAAQALQLQRAQLSTRSASVTAQESVLGQRSRQLGEQQSGYSQQISALRDQQRLLSEEISGLKEIEAKGFASANRIRALERALADLKGREAAMVSEIARAGEGQGETRMQALSIRSSTQEQVATELRDTQARLSEVLPRLIAAREQLEQAEVRAPASGQVVGLTTHTVGGVVAPGQTLMDVVPQNRMLIIQAQVNPQDADDVFIDQTAQVRFTSVHDTTLPLLTGRVRTISADSFTEEQTGRTYFKAEIEVPATELARVSDSLGRGQLRPGLPVEAVMNVRKRTALQYILEPLANNWWRSLREL